MLVDVRRVERHGQGSSIRRGIERGDLRPDADVDIATELLVGPVYFRLMFGGELSLDFANRVVDNVLRGYAVTSTTQKRLPSGSARIT